MKKIVLSFCFIMFIQIVLAQTIQEPQIHVAKKVRKGQTLKYEFVNRTKRSVYVFDPMQIKIEKKKNGIWVQLETPYCPCGRACPPPPEIKEVMPNENIAFEWNLEESLCENNEEKRRKVEKGLYRVILYYGTNPQDKQKLTKQFKIK